MGKAASRSRPIWPDRSAASASSASWIVARIRVACSHSEQCRVGGPDAPADPLEQEAPGLPFKSRDVLAHARGREVESGRGGRHRPGLDDRLQHLEAADIDHIIIKSH